MRKKNKHELCGYCTSRITSKSTKREKQKIYHEKWSKPIGIAGWQLLVVRICDRCDREGLRKVIEEKLNNNKLKTFPCPTCNIEIKQGGHWNINLCLHALTNRVKALEQQLEAERQARFYFVHNLIWQPNCRVNYLVSLIKFQFYKLGNAVNSANEVEASKAVKELVAGARELLKEAGL